ncbi:38940_t:CDS:2, partial [Gigaspora margarita]
MGSFGTVSSSGPNIDIAAKVLIALVASVRAWFAILEGRLITGELSIGKLIVD